MAYDRVIPIVDVTARLLSEALKSWFLSTYTKLILIFNY